MIATIVDSEQRSQYKRMMIQAELAASVIRPSKRESK